VEGGKGEKREKRGDEAHGPEGVPEEKNLRRGNRSEHQPTKVAKGKSKVGMKERGAVKNNKKETGVK